MHRDIDKSVFSKDHIASRVAEMAGWIEADYRDLVDEGIVMIALLRGAAPFAADLSRAIDLPVELDYMRISSYGDGAVSSGKLEVKSGPDCDIADKHVLVVEDVIDSGLTLSLLVPMLKDMGAKSVEVAVLMRKEGGTYAHAVDARYVGFKCPDGFVVGYGLDYAGKYRNLPYIGVLKDEVIARKSGAEDDKNVVAEQDHQESPNTPNL